MLSLVPTGAGPDQLRRPHVRARRQHQGNGSDDQAQHGDSPPTAALRTNTRRSVRFHSVVRRSRRSGRQRRALRRPAVDRRGGHAEGREHQQGGQQRAGQLGRPGQGGADASEAEQGERSTRPSSPAAPPTTSACSLVFGVTQERGLAGEQRQHRRPRHDQRGGLPDEERAERVAPGRAGAPAQQRDRPDQAEQDQHRDGRDQERA